jgi:hypothetical protein
MTIVPQHWSAGIQSIGFGGWQSLSLLPHCDMQVFLSRKLKPEPWKPLAEQK